METTNAPTEIDACCADCASSTTAANILVVYAACVLTGVVAGKLYDRVRTYRANRKIQSTEE